MNTMPATTRPFDPTDYLKSEEAIGADMTAALSSNDPALIADASDVVANARMMTPVEREVSLAESIRRRFAAFGGVELEPHPPVPIGDP